MPIIQRIDKRTVDRNLEIRTSDRVFVVGSTGSGKTTLVKALLWKLPSVFVLDPKHTFTLPPQWESRIYHTMAELRHHDDETDGQAIAAIYRPTLDNMSDGCDDFFYFLFDRRDCYVYVDEAMRITNATRIGKGYATVLQLGRERNVGCWSATQRPANIPVVLLTEAEHFFVFRLRSPDDRDRMFKYTGQPELERIPPDQHGYWYYSDKTGQLRYWPKANVGSVLT